MRNSSFGSKEKSGWKIGGETSARANGGAQETDPLIRRGTTTTSSINHRSSSTTDNPNLRERRSSRSSPITVSLLNQRFGGPNGEEENYQAKTMDASSAAHSGSVNSKNSDEPTTSYTQLKDDASRTGNGSVGGNSSASYQNSTGGGSRSVHSLRRTHLVPGENVGEGQGNPPLLEIPEEIYRVRRAALQVLKPLTRTWVRIAIILLSFARTPFLATIRSKYSFASFIVSAFALVALYFLP